MCLLVSDLLALRTEEEWEEVKQRISDLPQTETDFWKVLLCMLIFDIYTLKVVTFPSRSGSGNVSRGSAFEHDSVHVLFVLGSAHYCCSLFQGRNETGGCWPRCSYFHQACHCHQGNRLSYQICRCCAAMFCYLLALNLYPLCRQYQTVFTLWLRNCYPTCLSMTETLFSWIQIFAISPSSRTQPSYVNWSNKTDVGCQ